MTTASVEAFRAWLLRRTGLQLGDARGDLLGDLLARRAAEHGVGPEAYLAALASEPMASLEERAIAGEVTVHETYFFRHPEQLQAFVDAARRLQPASRPLRILSAGCSSGEEPYTLSMLLLDALPRRPSPAFAIDAFDLDPGSIEGAIRARYAPWSLRATPAHLRARWFRAIGPDLALDPAVTRPVRFAQGNLTVDDPAWLSPGTYDVVFCRNVLMYLAPEAARAAVARLARTLVPGGLLFLGHAETLRGLSDDFDLRHTEGAFHYALRPRPEALPTTLGTAPGSGSEGELPARPADWVRAIERAVTRVAAITVPGPERTATPPASAPRSRTPPWDLRAILAHIAEERWDAARHALDALPPAAAESAEVLLVRALLLTRGDDVASAEAACAALLARDGPHPEAHYLMALCRENAGDRARAEHHHRAACELDERFAMPHIHLGLLARSRGDEATARRELDEALALLDHDQPARLALFGGGFDRSALRRLCRVEHRRTGGRP